MKKRFCWLGLVPAMFLLAAGAWYGVSSPGILTETEKQVCRKQFMFCRCWQE